MKSMVSARDPSQEEVLLHILPERTTWSASPEAIRAEAAQTQIDLGAHIVSSRLASRQDVVKALLDMKGVYASSVEGEFVEARIARAVPLEAALSAGIWPLAVIGARIYVLASETEPAPAELRIEGDGTLQVVALGTVANVKARTRGCYAVLSRFDPARRSFPEFLKSLGLLKEKTGSRRHERGSMGEEKGSDTGIAEDKLAQARGAYSDLPVIDQHRNGIPPDLLPLRVERDVLWVVSDHTRLLLSTSKAVAGAAAIFDGHPEGRTLRATGGSDSAVPAIADHLLLEGVLRHCSDIHIERYEDSVEVRLRKDGNLFRYPEGGVTTDNVQGVVTRLKVAARIDIAETRRPQDGVIRRKFGERSVDYRVATQPTIWGENIVLRILEQSAPPRLDGLGLEEEHLRQLRRVLADPQGLLLVTGPTGSGKTTTLYAMLQELKTPEIKILTAEDPVEYAIDGIQQSSVNDSIGDTFARYIRAFLRQDPDVILVGEIRDEETAEAALRAALTGHLVLSTVHANDVFGVVRRLADLGVEPSLLAQTLTGIIGQRLVRKVCGECSVPHIPSVDLVSEFCPHGIPAGANFRKGRGCAHCRQTGYAGRVAAMELWIPDDAARDLLDAGGHPAELRKAAAEAGFEPLVLNAFLRAVAGVTTLEEIRNVVPYASIARYLQGSGTPVRVEAA
jgi:type II secretory ATPase GspE/PulE/Tfp pilus assembly ATPase PilB-like protein